MSGLNLQAAGTVLNSGLASIGRLKWILFIILGVVIVGAVIYMINQFKKKKVQWTHKIRVRRIDRYDHVIPGEEILLARRNRNKDGVDIFELQKPLLGNLEMPIPGKYSGANEFSIVLDSDNRIWNNMGEYFDKDKQSINISAVHAGIDIQMQELNNEWKRMHPVSKKITALEVIKAGLMAIAIIAALILGIVALQNHAKNVDAQSQAQIAQAQAMNKFADSINVMSNIANIQQLQMTPALKALYPNQDISQVINKYRVNATNSSN